MEEDVDDRPSRREEGDHGGASRRREGGSDRGGSDGAIAGVGGRRRIGAAAGGARDRREHTEGGGGAERRTGASEMVVAPVGFGAREAGPSRRRRPPQDRYRLPQDGRGGRSHDRILHHVPEAEPRGGIPSVPAAAADMRRGRRSPPRREEVPGAHTEGPDDAPSRQGRSRPAGLPPVLPALRAIVPGVPARGIGRRAGVPPPSR
mmetsp:Transcript_39307/g.94573  ORF Transcript_39307/g.94573 Transcript_39307/m.94573 type:complete len:205 (-) Transcript_39307:2256-2870(-)